MLKKWLFAAIVWLIIAFLFIKYVIQSWQHVVPHGDGWTLGVIITGLTVGMALCSLIETAISSNYAFDFKEWYDETLNKQAFLYHIGRYLNPLALDALQDKGRSNAIIVFINTLLSVAISVATLVYAIKEEQYNSTLFGWPLPLSGPTGFTVVGITLVMFLLGETIPKQLALKFRFQVLLLTGFIPYFLIEGRLTGWLATGITHPLEFVFGRSEG
jgi:CBS domain containing-hemolysin-like protein